MDARVHVTGEGVTKQTPARVGGRLVAKQERWRRVGLRDHLDAPGGWRITRLRIVIAAHQRNLQRPVALAPGRKRLLKRWRPPAQGMQEIAQHDEPLRARRGKQARQTREIACRGAAGQGHSAGTKRRRLAQMHIGDKQRTPPRPVKRPVGKQRNVLAGEHHRFGFVAQHAFSRQHGASRL